MLIGSVFTSIICYYINAFYSGQLLNYNIKEQVKDILPSFIIAGVAALISYLPVLAYDSIWQGENWSFVAYTILPIQLLIGLITYVTISEKVQISEYQEIKGIILASAKSILIKVKRQK